MVNVIPDQQDPAFLPQGNGGVNISSFHGLTFSIQNVRSMNISTRNDLTIQKILAIVSVKTDVIFLSDLRLNSIKQKSAIHDLEKKFFLHGYKFIHNSCTSIRGVGILLHKKIVDSEFAVLNSVSNGDGNFLLLHVELNRQKFLLCSVYGPNKDTELTFYDEFRAALGGFACPKIIGGDWNATFDLSDVEFNLDVINMRNIPSFRRSQKIHELCRELDLLEPYRIINPNKKEYTFIPSSRNENNRSRLDFFLISRELFGPSTQVIIPNCLSSTLFDHKNVTMTLEKRRLPNKNIIKDTILNNVDLEFHVKAAVFDCYLLHYDPPDQGGLEVKTQHLAMVGRVMTLLSEIKNLDLTQSREGRNDLTELTISGKRAEIRLIFEDLPELEYFENLQNIYDPTIFFQTLVSCIKNNVLSHQATIFKIRNEKRNHFNKLIRELKQDFNRNKVEILTLERQLSDIVEGELKDELLHFKKFELLNNERITPHFMNLAKNCSKSETLSMIKKDSGEDFTSVQESSNHIFNYYKDIYKKDNRTIENVTLDTLNDFLGDVSTHRIVSGAKLTNNERDELEQEITIADLTKSINGANMASAPGADGVSNKFIKNFWDYFKSPLLKLCRYCFENNEMPLVFRTANIKLIRKKEILVK